MKLLKKILADLGELAEPAFKEYKTTEYITSFLKKYNIPIDNNLKTGCFGTIDIGSKKTIAFRADIDALPIDNENRCFKHLCGHHGHTAGLLLALKKIISNREKLKANIRYIFQPAEENGRGAKFMINNGALENVDEIYGLHGDPVYKIGEICIKSGYLMAGACLFNLKIEGKSTHAAYPHQGSDVIVATAEFINLCQNIISRMKAPAKAALISFCMINGGYAENILPDKAEVKGTFRFFDNTEKELIANKMNDILNSIENIFTVRGKLNFNFATEPIVNNDKLTKNLIRLFQKANFKVVEDYDVVMGAEDFSAFLVQIPGVYVKMGIAKSKNHPPLHNKDFFVPFEAVEKYIEFWEQLAFN